MLMESDPSREERARRGTPPVDKRVRKITGRKTLVYGVFCSVESVGRIRQKTYGEDKNAHPVVTGEASLLEASC